MRRRLLLIVVLVIAATVPAQQPTGVSVLEELTAELDRPLEEKTADFPERVEERREQREAAAEAAAEEIAEADTGEKIEQATEEVGKALGPVSTIWEWLTSLPGYWEALLVGGGCFVVLNLLYFFVMLGIKHLMKKRDKAEWKFPRRYSFFVRVMFFSISGLIGMVWVGETTGWLFDVAKAVTGLAAAFLAINVFSYLVLERGRKKRQGKPLPVLFQQVIRVVLYVLAILTIAGTSLGLDFSAVLASSAMLSIVLGLALQDTLGNVFSGMSIHGSKPFEIGDWVQIKEYEGQVVEMNWREVRLRTFEQDNIVLPNSMIASSDFVNYSRPTNKRMILLDIGTSYADPPEKVRRVIGRVLEEIDGIEPARRHLFLIGYNDFSIDYRIRFFINDYAQVRRLKAEVYNRLWYAFKRAGITIPFPIRDVNLHRPDAEADRLVQEQELEERHTLLDDLELFESLDDEIKDRLVRSLQRQLYSPGEAVVVQGEPGDTFYIVAEGVFAVFIKKGRHGQRRGIKVGELKRGDFFGEMSLLTGEERTATVGCAESGVLYALDKKHFGEIILSRPELSNKLASVASKRVSSNLSQLSKYISEDEQAKLDDREKNVKVKKAILTQMKEFFGF
jgi:small-conductance mechanosensitive channel